MLERELDIQRMMAEGHTFSQICEILATKYDVSPRTIERQYQNVVNMMASVVDEGRAELRAKLMARNDHLYRQSLAEGKYKTALDANVAQAKLGGLHDTVHKEQKMPDVINIGTADYSKPLKAVGESSDEKE